MMYLPPTLIKHVQDLRNLGKLPDRMIHLRTDAVNTNLLIFRDHSHRLSVFPGQTMPEHGY